ncbi:MAG TPA: nuclear transport factor 2 family protein [Candidatus Dormibacteraeota bacterium]|nr:nuclear transport factor 2 family protein [Candidatus Dormibacteraeota bacterium]
MKADARKKSVQAYFDGIAAKDMSRVPWALIRGRKAILEFFNSILPAVGSLKFLQYYAGDGSWVAGQAEIGLANGKTLYVLDAFRVENGEIIEQQNHYDPRPAGG